MLTSQIISTMYNYRITANSTKSTNTKSTASIHLAYQICAIILAHSHQLKCHLPKFSTWYITEIKLYINLLATGFLSSQGRSCSRNILVIFCCFEDIRRFNNLSVISQLGSRKYPISSIQVVRPGLEPRAPNFIIQELNHSTKTSQNWWKKTKQFSSNSKLQCKYYNTEKPTST